MLQDEFLEEYRLPIKACETFSFSGASSASAVDYYEDDFKSYQNLLCQLNSIEQVTSMWRGSEMTYDAVFYLRPDMLYNCPFPVHLLDNLRSDAVYIADFHHWHGYNDRFALGRPEVAGLWGERYVPLDANGIYSVCKRNVLVRDFVYIVSFVLVAAPN